MLLVYRYLIKSLTVLLNSQARACNFVWNFCNDTQQQALTTSSRPASCESSITLRSAM